MTRAAMQIEVANEQGATIVRPATDRLDIEVAGEFRTMLLSLIDQGHRHLVVDLKDVTFIDSSGLGALVSALKTIKRVLSTSYDTSLSVGFEVEGHAYEKLRESGDYKEGIAAFSEKRKAKFTGA